ncbi:leucyl/phenylalanyl-tRNA--protein transferase [Novosphingobium sp. MBES04]|uniref:leucyl/phenylalanyl-tRNA--protein transferase n=1 Tax=Novosphingobium sp. MBES04 TaxID=1206458 RepID=UPI0007230ECC|nr:leucyl/phenylalanyl-tRNA--protein transferase [Novosphingobium sp. MBES04]
MHAPKSDDIIEPDILMLAYRSGIFPMADSREDPEVFWIEPRMRAILPLERLHVSHSLARTLKRGRFEVTCNAAFSQVMDACAAPRAVRPSEFEEDGDETGESWISHRIQRSYEMLHTLGLAHSVECWQHDAQTGERALVGGLYGVGFDRVFCGESMFSRTRDSSKVALCWLVAALRRGGAQLLDCQFITSHLASLGAEEIPQARYLTLLNDAQDEPETPDQSAALSLPDAFAALLDDAGEAEPPSSPGKFIAQFLTQTS